MSDIAVEGSRSLTNVCVGEYAPVARQGPTPKVRLGSALALVLVIYLSALCAVAGAQTAYTYSTSSTSTAWLTTTNWTGNTGHYPGLPTTASSSGGAATDLAQFGAVSVSSVGINFNTTGGGLTLGNIDASSTFNKAISIGDSSSSTTGVLTLQGNTFNSVANTVVSNEGSSSLTLAPAQGSGVAMSVSLGSTANVAQVNGSGSIVISAAINQASAGSSLTLAGTGAGTLTLSGTNSFTGGLNITGSEADVPTDASLGAAGGSVTINGGRLAFTSTTTIDPTRGIFLGANPTGSNTLSTFSTSGSPTIVTYNSALQNLNASTVGDLVKQGKGTLQLGGVSTYSGNTFVNNGTVQLAGANRLPTGTVVTLGQAASNNSGALNLNGYAQQIAGLNSVNSSAAVPTVKNTVTSTAAATLTLGGSGSYTYGDVTATTTTGSTTTYSNSGVLTGALAVNKTGSGTQAFGDANTYTGGTTINGGTLLANTPAGTGTTANSATGTGGVTIGAGGTLGGSGNAANAAGTVVAVSGTIQGGLGTAAAGTPATLTTGAEQWNGGGTLLDNVSASGTMADHLVLSSLAVSAGNGGFFVNVTGTGTPTLPASGKVVLATDLTAGTSDATTASNAFGPSRAAATLSALSLEINGSTATAAASGFALSTAADGSGGYDLILTTAAAPEPTSLLLVAAAVTPLALGRRRRRGVTAA